MIIADPQFADTASEAEGDELDALLSEDQKAFLK